MGWNHKHLRKLKLSMVLPTLQVLLAVALWEWGRRTLTSRALDTPYWPTSALICYGINAPAVFFKLLIFPFTRGNQSSAGSISGYGLEEIFFFLGVGILWFCVGRSIDMQALEKTPSKKLLTKGRVLADLLLMSIGVALFAEGFHGLRTPWKWNNYWGNAAESVLFLAWSFVLVVLPGQKLIKGIRRWQARSLRT